MILNIKLEYNPENETVKVKSCTVEKTEPTKVYETNDPQITLDASKYTLNPAAAEMLGVVAGDRIDIKYQVIDGIEYPVIGTEESFGSGGGNKLTKSLTVAYRGKNNDRLLKFGDVFTVTPMKDLNGLFVLIGNAEKPAIPDEIEVNEDNNNHEDLTDSDGDPLTFEDNFDNLEDSEEISEDALTFE